MSSKISINIPGTNEAWTPKSLPKVSKTQKQEFGLSETAVDRQKLIEWWDQDVLTNARILVIGAGAIGNEVLKNLALMGAGHLMIADMDIISTSNLSRTVLFTKDDVNQYKAKVAAERVREMSVCPDVEVDYFIGNIVTELGEGVFRQFDLVMGCLDNMEARMSLGKRCNHLKIPYVDGGIRELNLTLQVFHYPHSSCFCCGLTSDQMEKERARVRNSCDGTRKVYLNENKAPTLILSTAIVAALAVQEGIKILHKDETVKYGIRYYFFGQGNRFETVEIPLKDDEECVAHYCYDQVISTEFGNNITLSAFLVWATEQLGQGTYFVDLYEDDMKFVIDGKCPGCSKNVDIFRPGEMLTRLDFFCEECKQASKANERESVTAYSITDLYASDERICNKTLEELGIPKAHIVKVRDAEDFSRVFYIELSGDLPHFLKTISIRDNI